MQGICRTGYGEIIVPVLLVIAVMWGVSISNRATAAEIGSDLAWPLGLPKLSVDENANDPQLRKIGQQLFFDKRLSADGTISCGECHQPDKAFSDGRKTAKGIDGQIGTRNTPSLLNVAFEKSLFWDGRLPADLARQAKKPLLNPREHGLADESAILEAVRDDSTYVKRFAASLGQKPTAITVDDLMEALAAYEQTLISGGSPFDRYFFGKEADAISNSAIRGWDLFRGRAGCTTCHAAGEKYALFTDHDFHVSPLGIAQGVLTQLPLRTNQVVAAKSKKMRDVVDIAISANVDIAALGRFVVTLDPGDVGKFKTPSLRNVEVTPPYMHDGSVPSLRKALELELYRRVDAVKRPVPLTSDEKEDLLAFLRSLTDPRFTKETQSQ